MPRSDPEFTSEDFRLFDDALHKSLTILEDFRHGPWYFRCVEFHFEPGIYPSGSHFGMHLHKEMQFEVPLSGLFEFSIEGRETMLVKPGTTFFIPPETNHQWRCIKKGMMIGILVSLVPSPEALTNPITPHLSSGIIRNTVAADLRAGFLYEFRRTRKEGLPATKRLKAWIFLIIDELLTKVVGLPEEEINDFENSGTNRAQRIASRLMRYIEANLNGDLSLKNLSELAGLSSRQLQRIFTDITGDSCHKYVMDKRVEAGRDMLERDPNCSIKETAYACGFSSPAHFCVSFKKAYGKTPSAFMD